MLQRSPEWFEARKGRITASVAGAALGQSPFATRMEALRHMVRSKLGAKSEFEGNVATEWGQAMEEGAHIDLRLEHGVTVEPPPGFVPFEDWAGISPDGLVGDDALVEIKCPYGRRKSKEGAKPLESIADQQHYYSQVQFQLYVTGREKCYFYQWTPWETKLEVVHISEDWQGWAIPELKAFYQDYLKNLQEPEVHLQDRLEEYNAVKPSMLMCEIEEIDESIERLQQRREAALSQIVEITKGPAIVAGRHLKKGENGWETKRLISS